MKQAIVLLATACIAAALPAATFTEPPDRPAAGGPTYTLESGQNLITGSVHGCSGCALDEQDNFTLDLPVGLTITSITFSGTYDSGGGTNQQLACFTNAGCYGSGFFSGMPTFTGSRSYTATAPYSSSNLGGFLAGTSDYTLTVNVDTTVPEPSTALLFLPVLGLLALKRRKA